MPLDLARIRARAFAVQTLNGAFNQRREILAASGQGQGFGKESDGVRRRHRRRQRVRVFPRRMCLKRRLLGGARQIEHLAARGLDEQGFLGAEVISDLARKCVSRRRDVRNRGSGKAPLPEQAAGAVEQARAHLASGRTRGAGGMLGIVGGHFWSCLDGLWGHFYLRPLVCMAYKQIKQDRLFPAPVSLARRAKILITRAIRGSRPGAERTVSAVSPLD